MESCPKGIKHSVALKKSGQHLKKKVVQKLSKGQKVVQNKGKVVQNDKPGQKNIHFRSKKNDFEGEMNLQNNDNPDQIPAKTLKEMLNDLENELIPYGFEYYYNQTLDELDITE